MSRQVKVYQTLENRGNFEDILTKGSFACNWENTWLGDGYYFWEKFITNAHWWGEEVRKYKNGYIICEATCDLAISTCFDLLGNSDHMEQIKEVYEYLKKQGLADEKTTLNRLLKFLQTETTIFPYEAIRASGSLVRKSSSKYSFTLSFENGKNSYLDVIPPIQICFLQKTSLGLRGLAIVYPT